MHDALETPASQMKQLEEAINELLVSVLGDIPSSITKRIEKYSVPCKSFKTGNPIDGYDYDCEYEHSGEITCDDCICNGGSMSPQTGKRVYKRNGT